MTGPLTESQEGTNPQHTNFRGQDFCMPRTTSTKKLSVHPPSQAQQHRDPQQWQLRTNQRYGQT
jgi:hypothetical protein